MIRLMGLTRRFGPLTAVDGLDLEIREGEIFGLVGPDGAGKTTTLRMIAGLVDADAGRVEVGGIDVAREPDRVKDMLGYMAQRFGLYGDLTVEENLLFYSDLFGVEPRVRDERMAQFLDMTRMTPFRARPAAQLSGGMKQKLALTCTLLHRPRVLVLDEPTNGVDPVSRRDFWAILYGLAKEGMTILTSTAYLDEAERCDRVGLMRGGRQIELDTPARLRASLAPLFRVVRGPREARGWLQRREEVLAAEPAGAAIHVCYRETAPTPEELRTQLQNAGFPCEVEAAAPSLEDVYIARIRRAEAAHV